MEKTSTRDELLRAAKTVFARQGFEGATVKGLADEAGVNVSLVSYYFEGKEGLYRSCLERFGRDRLAAAERVLKSPQSAEDFRVRLRLFVEEFLSCHIEEPEISIILLRECANEMSKTKDLFRNVFVKVFETLVHFLKAGQKNGILREDLDPLITGGHFFGGLVHMLRMNSVAREIFGKSLEDAKYRDQVITEAIRNLMEGTLRA